MRIPVELVRRRSCGCNDERPYERIAGDQLPRRDETLWDAGGAAADRPRDRGGREFFCLLGPSGCGKTTTLNLDRRLRRAERGEILIRGAARQPAAAATAAAVNTVFQSYALFPHMTVRDNVGFGLKMARVPSDDAGGRVEEVARARQARGVRRPAAGAALGGQQQRVAVARALVNRPAVLLLDEPLGALDLKLRKRLQIELAQIHRDVGTTFVYVTHDQEEAMSMATRIAVMNEGRDRAGRARRSEIYHQPKSRFVADFIGESNFIEVEVGAGGKAALDRRCGSPCPGAQDKPAGRP